MGKLLGIFAHPDDESIAPGGTLAKYAHTGNTVDLVCATRGEVGGLADMRSSELTEAAGFLGVRSITFLDYADGKLATLTPGEVENALVKVLTEVKPDIVITHEPAGITNHPDHVKMSYAATFAFQTYAAAQEEVQPDNPPKLYYACVPETVLSYLIKHRYFPTELHDKPLRGVDDKRITTVINIKRFAKMKRQALEAHLTQQPKLGKYLTIPHNPFFIQEYFVLRMIGTTEVFMGKNDRILDRL